MPSGSRRCACADLRRLQHCDERASLRTYSRTRLVAYNSASTYNESGRMTAAEHDAKDLSLPAGITEPRTEEWLTDVIDELRRTAFRRALDRRHVAPSYRAVIESAHLVRAKAP